MPFTPNFPAKATYCNKGNSLQLTGSDGEYLFGLFGLRTLDLGKLNCADGVQGALEDGPDCGSICGTPCAGCDDMVQNGVEEGVDCGSACNSQCMPP